MQSAFTLRFALLDLTKANANRFSYRLVGLEDSWTPFSADRSATYTNIEPGSYRFEVRALSAAGIPASNTATLNLTVAPPPWATAWAYLGYALLITALLTYVVARLRERARRARAYQAQLEQDVAERTVELRESNRQLEAATRAKSDFLARMSHEIRTPMNGVFGTAELLLRTQLETRQKQHVNTIHRSSGALISLINDILDFSKIEAKKLELETVPMDLAEAIVDVARLFSYQASKKNVAVVVQLEAPELPLKADPLRLRQILSNLVGNAIKFTEHGYVELRCEAREDGLAISVQDTGIGIKAENQQKIFEDFSQEDGSTSRRYGGSGLGLSICKQLVDLMGGELQLHSEENRGSTFTALLPLTLERSVPWPALAETGALVLLSNARQSELVRSVLL